MLHGALLFRYVSTTIDAVIDSRIGRHLQCFLPFQNFEALLRKVTNKKRCTIWNNQSESVLYRHREPAKHFLEVDNT